MCNDKISTIAMCIKYVLDIIIGKESYLNKYYVELCFQVIYTPKQYTTNTEISFVTTGMNINTNQ